MLLFIGINFSTVLGDKLQPKIRDRPFLSDTAKLIKLKHVLIV
jgi:hypothetical protein